MVVHAFNTSPQDEEAVQGLQSEFQENQAYTKKPVSKKNKTKIRQTKEKTETHLVFLDTLNYNVIIYRELIEAQTYNLADRYGVFCKCKTFFILFIEEKEDTGIWAFIYG